MHVGIPMRVCMGILYGNACTRGCIPTHLKYLFVVVVIVVAVVVVVCRRAAALQSSSPSSSSSKSSSSYSHVGAAALQSGAMAVFVWGVWSPHTHDASTHNHGPSGAIRNQINVQSFRQV